MTPLNALIQLLKSDYDIPDPGSDGTIHAKKQFGSVSVVTAGAEGRTVASPTKKGLILTISHKTAGGALTLTITDGYNSNGNTSIVSSVAGEFIVLESIEVGSSVCWRLVGKEGTNAIQENITVDVATIGALTATSLSYTPVARTATADGSGTGTIADAGMLQFVNVTAGADANAIIVLPTPTPGTIVILHIGATGYELRSSAPATVAINGGTGASAESAIGANTTVIAICASATSWKAFQIGSDGTLAKVETAA